MKNSSENIRKSPKIKPKEIERDAGKKLVLKNFPEFVNEKKIRRCSRFFPKVALLVAKFIETMRNFFQKNLFF